MKEYAIRLEKGADLKASIEDICLKNGFNTCVVLSAVGCVYQARFRRAKATSYFEKVEDYEIVSLIGTVCQGKVHMHICLAEDSGAVVGGHLEKGCLINTTCELVLGVLDEYESQRVFDENTGYDEIVFKKKVQTND